MNYSKIAFDECKGCRLCVQSCPNKCLGIGSRINQLGYQAAVFMNPNCTACGICYYVCPEPGAITVYKDEERINA
jgi:NAD-dependent dihydropyrimidine dehydrogenase PreA subunit